MSTPITLADVQRWRSLPPDRRTSFYIEYARRTGSEQALQQASISQFSDAIGGTALLANALAKRFGGASYPDIDIATFSDRVKQAELNAIERSIRDRGTAVLSDLDMAIAARQAWLDLDAGRISPVNAEVLKEGIYAGYTSGDRRYMKLSVTPGVAMNLVREVLTFFGAELLTSNLAAAELMARLPAPLRAQVELSFTPAAIELMLSPGTAIAAMSATMALPLGFESRDFPGYERRVERIAGRDVLVLVDPVTGAERYVSTTLSLNNLREDWFSWSIDLGDAISDGLRYPWHALAGHPLRDTLADYLGGGIGARPLVGRNVPAPFSIDLSSNPRPGSQFSVSAIGRSEGPNSLSFTFGSRQGQPSNALEILVVDRKIDLARYPAANDPFQQNLMFATDTFRQYMAWIDSGGQGLPASISSILTAARPIYDSIVASATPAQLEQLDTHGVLPHELQLAFTQRLSEVPSLAARVVPPPVVIQSSTVDGVMSDSVKITARRGLSNEFNAALNTPISGSEPNSTLQQLLELEISIARTSSGTTTSKPRVRVITPGKQPTEVDYLSLTESFGATLARALNVRDPLAATLLGTSVGVVTRNIAEELRLFGADKSVGFENIGDDIKNAGIGAISTFLTASAIRGLGVEGTAADVLNIGTGHVVTKIATNIAQGAEGAQIFQGIVDLTQLANAFGSYLGNKFASAVVSARNLGESIVGSFGSAMGAAYGQVLIPIPFIGAMIGSAVGQVAYTLVARNPVVAFALLGVPGLALFGLSKLITAIAGTPRSGADLIWDQEKQQFEVVNGYARRGGSRAAAEQAAGEAGSLLNGVLAATGSKLINPLSVQAGNYGMWGRQFVYRPRSTQAREAITHRFNNLAELVQHGSYIALSGMVDQMGGGDRFAKRALAATLRTARNARIDQTELLGNMSVAADYHFYLMNSTAVMALMSAEPDSALAASWAVTLARVQELGLNKRSSTDWIGGFATWFDELPDGRIDGIGLLPTQLLPIVGNGNERSWLGLDTNGSLVAILDDTILAGDKDRIAGTGSNDTIVINGEQLAAASGAAGQAGSVNAGLTVNDAAHNGSALKIDVAATIDAGGGDDTVRGGDLGNELFGGTGNDTLIGGKLDDWLIGGAGDDRLYAGSVADDSLDSVDVALGVDGGSGNYLDGGAGDDRLFGSKGSDWLAGGEGADLLHGGAGGDILDAGRGDDGSDAAPAVRGGPGSDQYVFRRGDGRDVLFDSDGGNPGAPLGDDELTRQVNTRSVQHHQRNWAGNGQFSVDGSVKGGEDALVFGPGITMGDLMLIRSGSEMAPGMDLIIRVTTRDANGDMVWNLGDDEIIIKDWFEGTRRIEWFRFANGEEIRIGDFVSIRRGTEQGDVIVGTNGRDWLYGGDGADRMFGLADNDWVIGGRGNDLVSGNDDDDYVIGGADDDVALGGLGRDVVTGEQGDDRVYGGAGDDIVSGGHGDDEVVTGDGSDVIRFNRGDGRDTIADDWTDTWETVYQSSIAVDGTSNENDGYTNGYKLGTDGKVRKVATGEEVFDGANWLGQFDYNEQNGLRTLRRWVKPQSGPETRNASGTDVLEFGVGIDIPDLVFERNGDDLLIAITKSGGAIDNFAEVKDQIRVRDWFSTVSGAARSIEQFQFVETGRHDLTSGPDGMDIVVGTGSSDGATTLSGNAGRRNWITGGAGDDTLTGAELADILNGNSGTDTLDAAAGEDVLYGGDGNDVLTGGAGADRLLGGAGSDTASYANAPINTAVTWSGVNVFLDTAQEALAPAANRNSGHAAGDTFISIENITGSVGRDRLYGDAGGNVLDGGAGNDELYGGAGDDLYVFSSGMGIDRIEDRVMNGAAVHATQVGAGSDLIEVTSPGVSLSSMTIRRSSNDLQLLQGSNQFNVVGYFASPDAMVEALQFADGFTVQLARRSATDPNAWVNALIFGGAGTAEDDVLIGTTGADTMNGGDGNDVISGSGGADRLNGGNGDDVLEGGGGTSADVYDGGSDSLTAGGTPGPGRGDTIRFVASAQAVTVSLLAPAMPMTGGEAQGDTIVVDSSGVSTIENVIGSDVASAGDRLTGDSRANLLSGLAGNDIIRGEAGDDVLLGGSGADQLHGGAGADNVDAGEGDDTVVFGDAGNDFIAGGAGNDTLDGGTGDDQLDGGTGNDTLHGRTGRDTLGGGDGADTLNGHEDDDRLAGGADNDTLHGGAGNDTLAGEAGDDQLRGEAGDDSYVFDANSGQDTLIDAEGANRIVFSDVSSDRVWMRRDGDNLVVEVIGGTTRVTASNFFAATGRTQLREIATADASLFLKYAGGQTYSGSLIEAMSLASPTDPQSGMRRAPANAAEVPADVAAKQAEHWWPGGKAAPQAVGATLATNEDVALAGVLAVTDHDENIASFGVGVQARHGTVGVNAATGAWTYTPRADFHGTDEFSLIVRDADGQSASASFSVTVSPVNDAPVFGAAPTLVVPENSADGTPIAMLSATDVDGDQLTFDVHGTPGALHVEPNGRLVVRDGRLLNHEAAATRTVDVQVSDGRGGVTVRPFTVTVSDVNERPDAPVQQGAGVARVNESFGGVGTPVAGSTIATFSRTDVDRTTPSLRVRSGDTTVFDTAGGNLVFRAGFNPDFETLAQRGGVVLVDRDGDNRMEAEFTAEVEAFDGELASLGTASVTVGIKDVNEAPSAPVLSNANPTLVERDRPQEGTALPPVSLGTLSAVDADLHAAGERHVFSVADGRFEIVNGNELRLRQDARLDFEGSPSDAHGRFVDVTVTVRDRAGGPGSLSASSVVRVRITDAIDYLYGTSGDDRGPNALRGEAGHNVIFGRGGNDELIGAGAGDELRGGEGNDSIRGEAGEDWLFGDAGDDAVDGGAGRDVLFGGFGDDVLAGGEGNDDLHGEDGADTLSGDAGNDLLDGGDARDVLWGGSGDDVLRGGTGNDELLGGLGADRFEGGDGYDAANYSFLDHNAAAIEGVTVDMADPARNHGAAVGDTYSSIEWVHGTDHVDELSGDGSNNVLNGMGGDDLISGRNGDDTLLGGPGADRLLGEGGNDRLEGHAGADTLLGGDGIDALFGGSENDTLEGGAGVDRLEGGAGDDLLRGGSGDDSFVFRRGDGHDRIDQTGAPTTDRDVLGFSAREDGTGGIANTDLWFRWDGNDILVNVLGASGSDGSVRLLDFRNVDADQRANVGYVLAGENATRDLAIGNLATTLDLFAQAAGWRPTQREHFDSFYNWGHRIDGLTFRQHWDNFWSANQAPSLLFNNSAAFGAGWNENQFNGSPFQLTFRLSDNVEANGALNRVVHLVTAHGSTVEDTSANRLLSSIDVAWPGTGATDGTISVRTRAGASGSAFLYVAATDAGGMRTERWLPFSINAVADAPTLSASTAGGNSGGAGIRLDIGAQVTDTDGSELIERVEIAGVPDGFTFANAAGSVSAGNNHLGGGTWRFGQAQLEGLRLVAPQGWSRDLTGASALRVTAWSREQSNGSTAASATRLLPVRINAAPTAIAIAPASVPEMAAAGTVIGVARVEDPDRFEDNLLDLSGWGSHNAPGWAYHHGGQESEWLTTTGPFGFLVTALRTGQWHGDGPDNSWLVNGGGVGRSASVAIDPDKAHRFTIFVRPEAADQHMLLFTANARWDGGPVWVERATDGTDIHDPHFMFGRASQLGMQQGRWYRVEGIVLPRGHQLVSHGVFGGIFDVQTGQKVGDTATFRWNDTMPDNVAHMLFVSHGGQAQNGWSAQWTQPTIEELPPVWLGDDAGGRFRMDGRSGLVTVTPGAVLDHEAASGHSVEIGTADRGGFILNRRQTVDVTNVNERPVLNGVPAWGQLLFTEAGLGDRPANGNVLLATLGGSDPDGPRPRLEITRGDNLHFFTFDGTTGELRFNPAHALDFEYFWNRPQTYGRHDTDGDGMREVHVANIWVRATDGSLHTEEQLHVLIEDVNEAPSISADRPLHFGENTGAGGAAWFRAHDPEGQPVTFSIVPGHDAGGRYAVRSDGLLSIARPDLINFESGQTSFTIRVRATDTQNAFREQDFTIGVINEEERPHSPNATFLRGWVDEMVPGGPHHGGTVIARFALTDPDGPAPTMVWENNPNGWFEIVGNEVRIRPSTGLDHHWNRPGATDDSNGDGRFDTAIHDISVRARDATTGELSGAVSFSLLVEDVNQAPSITADQAVEIPENLPPAGMGGNWGTGGNNGSGQVPIAMSDPDPSPRFRQNVLQYVSGPSTGGGGQMFTLTPDGWVQFHQGSLDFESQRLFSIRVRAADANSPAIASEQDVPVRLLNRNDAPSLYVGGESEFWTQTSWPQQNPVVIADDPDGHGVTFSIINQSASRFTIHSNGVLSWHWPSQSEGSVTDWITVRAIDTLGASTDISLAVTLNPYPHSTEFTPFAIDLDGDGIDLTSLAMTSVRFDMDGDGDAVEATGWIGADDGLLVLDRNEDGLINGFAELGFGVHVEGGSDVGGLRAYDSNGNGFFDKDDERFSSFRIWRDANQDGVSQADELRSLTEWNISSIDLRLSPTGQAVEGARDNVVFASGKLNRPNGAMADTAAVFLAYWPDGNASGLAAPQAGGAAALHGESDRILIGATGGVRFAGVAADRPLPHGLTRAAADTVLAERAAVVAASGLPSAAELSQLPAAVDRTEAQSASATPQRAARQAPASQPSAAPSSGPGSVSTGSSAGVEAASPPSRELEAGKNSIADSTAAAASIAPSEATMAEAAERTPEVVAATQLLASRQPTSWGEDPLTRAVALLAADAPASLNAAAPTSIVRPTPTLVSAAALPANDNSLDRMIAAMAAFQAGQSIASAGGRGASPADAALAQLAPAI